MVAISKGVTEDTSDEIAKAWLPVEIQALTPTLATALHLPMNTHGVRVTQVFSEAAPATHLQVGDILTKLDGQDIEVSQPEETPNFFTMLRQYKIDAPVKVNGFRAGAAVILDLKTVRAPREERGLARYADLDFGLTLRSVTYKDRADEDAGAKENGAMVIDIAKGSWAALGGMHPGDIIHRIDDTPVESVEAAEAALKATVLRHPRHVVFFVARGIHTLFIQAQTDYSLSPVPGRPKVEPTVSTP